MRIPNLLKFRKLIGKSKFHQSRCCSQKPESVVPPVHREQRGPVSLASLGLMTIVGCGILLYYNTEKESKSQKVSSEVITTGKPALGGPWVLVDHNGIPRTDASYRGKFCLLYFGFTHCPDICPSELVKIGKIIDSLGGRNMDSPLQPLFISVDPSRDSVGQLRHYSKDFHPSFVFLTGTSDQVAVATRAYRVYFSKANETVDIDGEEDYLVDHSIVLYLISPEGEFLDFYTQRMHVSEISDKIFAQYKKWKETPPTPASAPAPAAT